MMEKRSALITGASRGIGRDIAIAFAKHGYKVFINYFENETEAIKTKTEADKFGNGAKLIKADIKDLNQVKIMVKSISEESSWLDVLVNNAGITKNGLIARMPEADWDSVLKTNLTGPFFLIKECARLMAKKKSGSIINISSIAAQKGAFGAANYSSSKGALLSLTKSCAAELGRLNIRVNAVMPGFHMTAMGKNAGADYSEQALNESVLHKTTDINELSEFIVFLAQTQTVSGQVFNFDSRII
jgi:3-oxoacyl-[acyl-carrier protein] reductase